MSRHEIERKYLVHQVPFDLSSYPASRIRQGYVIVSDDGTELRLRQKGQNFFQTIKRGRGLTRLEIEIPLKEEQFNALWPLTSNQRIIKTRYDVSYGAHCIELDIYEGSLAPLITAEIEFKTVDSSDNFMPPDWFVHELTENEAYKNQSLARFGLPAVFRIE